MNWFKQFYSEIALSPLSHWLETLPGHLAAWHKDALHGDFKKWCKLVDQLPETAPSVFNFSDKVEIGNASDISEYEAKKITGLLKQFMPWLLHLLYISFFFMGKNKAHNYPFN